MLVLFFVLEDGNEQKVPGSHHFPPVYFFALDPNFLSFSLESYHCAIWAVSREPGTLA